IYDNDSAPGINFSLPPVLELTEGTGDVPVTISLNSVPDDTVFISVIPDGQLRITGAPGEAVELVFAPNASALTNHIAIVKAYDDPLFEGDHFGNVSFNIVTTDVDYSSYFIDPFSITIFDNDLPPGIIFTDTSSLAGVEGDSAAFSVVLSSIPTATVTINFDPDDDLDLGKGHGVVVNYKFKDDSALIARIVNVYLYDDPVEELEEIALITCSITTSDSIYAAYIIPDILVHITDNDGVNIIESDPRMFNIYPSVSGGIFYYHLVDINNENTIEIFNELGGLIKRQTISSNAGELNLTGLPSGNYFVVAKLNEALFYSRLEIIH
ncbi:MAG: T9SS type A sorting domain-containing protein, partial [Chitinophagales bacterium]